MRIGAAAALVLAALAVAGVATVGGRMRSEAATAPPAAQDRQGGGGGIPVTAAAAERRDVPVLLDGIGTVQPFNTVTIRPRVDGELQQVAFAEGQTVRAGDLLARIDPRPFQAQLDQAKAKKAQDEAQLENARRDLARSNDLARRDFAPRQSVDQQEAQVAQLQAAVQGDQAAIDSAAVQLGYATIAAPITGRTGMRLVDQGNIVHAGDPAGIVTINQVQPISVVFTLPEEDVPAINREAAAGGPPLEVLAMSRDGKDELGRGRLALVDNQIDPATGTIRLKATFANAENTLWPGQFVNARLLLRTERGVVTVPSDAVQRGAQGLYAYVVSDAGRAELRWLKVGTIGGGVTVVTDGLKEGERVVTGGQYRLQPGASVAVRTVDAGTGAGADGAAR